MPINWESAVAKISKQAHLQPAIGSSKAPPEGKATEVAALPAIAAVSAPIPLKP
jgi:hypothetical protein